MARQSKAHTAAPLQQFPLQPSSLQPPPLLPQNPIASPAVTTMANSPQHVAFTRVRDSVYQRLVIIQGMIGNCASDFLTQTNLLLGDPNFGVGDGAEVPLNQDFGSLQMQPGAIPISYPAGPALEEKKERKKRQHDPNAPKRPLTPYFLYMQTARPIIAVDLGEGVPKGAVQEEGQRRWKSMSEQEKLGWNQAYQYNLRLYNARVHSYKAGNLTAKEMADEEAVRYCEEFNIPMPHVGGVDDEPVMDGSVVPQQLMAPVPIAPIQPEPAAAKPAAKPKASRKRKSEAIEPSQASPVVTPAIASPDKKPARKKAAPKPVEQPEKEEPKKSSRKKAKSG